MIGRQSLHCHGRSQIGATNPDVHHIGDRASTNLIRKCAHPGKRVENAGHHILSVHVYRTTIKVPQGRVQNGASFGVVDRGAVEHGVTPRRHACCVHQRNQRIPCVRVDIGLGVIK